MDALTAPTDRKPRSVHRSTILTLLSDNADPRNTRHGVLDEIEVDWLSELAEILGEMETPPALRQEQRTA